MREGTAMELTNETSASAHEAGAAASPQNAVPQQRADWLLAAAFFGVVLVIYAVLGYLVYALLA
jgi:hypothetical protein